MDTVSLKNKKIEIEKKLLEVEEAISLFSRSRILVKKQDYEQTLQQVI